MRAHEVAVATATGRASAPAAARLERSGTWVRGVMRALERVGLCAEEVCERAGLDYDTMRDPTALISEADCTRLWQSALTISADPRLGLHAGEHLCPRENHILAILAVSGRSLADGLTSLVKYQRLLADRDVVEIVNEGSDKVVRFRFGVPNGVLRHQQEFLVTAFQGLIDEMTLNQATAKVIRFEHAFSGGLDDYERVFRCDVRFDQAETSIVFSDEVWNMRLELWDPVLRVRLEALASEMSSRIQEPGFVRRVSLAVEELLAKGTCDLASTAKRMRVSERTLQRRLHEEGTRFREVIDATRRSIVQSARDQALSEDEIASLAGFGSARALRRALRRWAAF
ncbi:MAG: AraC family transcriptional regulator ligand-binding domain-containing protein [Myxococcota bacterium]